MLFFPSVVLKSVDRNSWPVITTRIPPAAGAERPLLTNTVSGRSRIISFIFFFKPHLSSIHETDQNIKNCRPFLYMHAVTRLNLLQKIKMQMAYSSFFFFFYSRSKHFFYIYFFNIQNWYQYISLMFMQWYISGIGLVFVLLYGIQRFRQSNISVYLEFTCLAITRLEMTE